VMKINEHSHRMALAAEVMLVEVAIVDMEESLVAKLMYRFATFEIRVE